jgi:hypothetical protein
MRHGTQLEHDARGTQMTLPDIPPHPELRWVWRPDEEQAILEYGKACAAAERDRCAKIAEDMDYWIDKPIAARIRSDA